METLGEILSLSGVTVVVYFAVRFTASFLEASQKNTSEHKNYLNKAA